MDFIVETPLASRKGERPLEMQAGFEAPICSFLLCDHGQVPFPFRASLSSCLHEAVGLNASEALFYTFAFLIVKHGQNKTKHQKNPKTKQPNIL